MCEKCCSNCVHVMQLTLDDVSCCNCCENYEYFDPIEGLEEEEEK